MMEPNDLPLLDSKVRKTIWMYACKVPRLLRVIPNTRLKAECEEVLSSNEQKLDFHADDRCIPSVLLVCRASYDVARQHYHRRKFVSGDSIYFNPAMDIIHFGRRVKGIDGINAMCFLAQKEYVQYISCDIEFWSMYIPQDLFHAFQKYRSLRKVIFYGHKLKDSGKLMKSIKKNFIRVKNATHHEEWQSPHLIGIHSYGPEQLNGWIIPKLGFAHKYLGGRGRGEEQKDEGEEQQDEDEEQEDEDEEQEDEDEEQEDEDDEQEDEDEEQEDEDDEQ
jgi:hypothetical protein